MKKYNLKFIIGFIYMIISVVLMLLTYINKIFLYIGFSSLGVSLRAFYFTFIQYDNDSDKPKEDKDQKVMIRSCIADYFLFYPILIAAIFSFVYLIFSDKLMNVWLKDICFNPMLALLSLYIGFDIYRLAGRLP